MSRSSFYLDASSHSAWEIAVVDAWRLSGRSSPKACATPPLPEQRGHNHHSGPIGSQGRYSALVYSIWTCSVITHVTHRAALGVPTLMHGHHLVYFLILFCALFHPHSLSHALSNSFLIASFVFLFIFFPPLCGANFLTCTIEHMALMTTQCWQLPNHATWWILKI